MMRRLVPLGIAMAIVAIGFAASAQQAVTYKAHLTAKDEVPPNASTGAGDGTFVLNPATKELTWTVTFSGLSGPATAAHIHGPAAPGANAGVVVPFDPPKAPAGEIKGSKVLTDEQIADLRGGKYYANIHTDANKGGEIRGQLMP
jgi:CHRD domain